MTHERHEEHQRFLKELREQHDKLVQEVDGVDWSPASQGESDRVIREAFGKIRNWLEKLSLPKRDPLPFEDLLQPKPDAFSNQPSPAQAKPSGVAPDSESKPVSYGGLREGWTPAKLEIPETPVRDHVVPPPVQKQEPRKVSPLEVMQSPAPPDRMDELDSIKKVIQAQKEKKLEIPEPGTIAQPEGATDREYLYGQDTIQEGPFAHPSLKEVSDAFEDYSRTIDMATSRITRVLMRTRLDIDSIITSLDRQKR